MIVLFWFGFVVSDKMHLGLLEIAVENSCAFVMLNCVS